MKTPLVVTALFALACDSPLAPGADRIEVTSVADQLTFPAAPPLDRYDSEAAVTHLADDDGVPLAVTDGGLVTVLGLALEPVSVVAADDEPLQTGRVLTTARRPGGLLVSAEAGLFHTFEGALLYSPASTALTGATALAVVPAPAASDGEVVWAALPDALHRLDASRHERIVFPAEDGPPTAVAALADVVLVAFDQNLYELDPADLGFRPVDVALGSITHALAAGDRLIAAGSHGLVVRAADGSYQAHPDLAPVLALSADSLGIAYALTGAGVVRLDPSGPIAFAPLPPPSSATWLGLALDREGDVWLAEPSALIRLATGMPVSFAAQVAPILEARCASCHALGEAAPRRDFTDYTLVLALSEAIFTRISTGLMPPPPNPGLDAAEYDLLVRWYAGERAP